MKLSLVVIRVANVERSADFYRALGLTLTKEQHSSGPEHYSADIDGTVLELYPVSSDQETTRRVRLGFALRELERVVEAGIAAGGSLVSPVKKYPWARRAVVEDPDGHRIELTETVLS